MRLIDAEALRSVLKWHHSAFIGAEDEVEKAHSDALICAIREVVNAPTIDAVPVVRCMECELWNDWDHAKEFGNFVCSCAYWSNEDGYVVYTKPDDFCSYGERKDGDGQWLN